MSSIPSNSIHLGRRYVAPDGTNVWVWPASDRQFQSLVQGALGLQQASESATAGIPSEGIVFLTLVDPEATRQALEEAELSFPKLLTVAAGEGRCKQAQLTVQADEHGLKKGFQKLLARQNRGAGRFPKLQTAAAVFSIPAVIALGWWIRNDQTEDQNIDWHKPAKSAPHVVAVDLVDSVTPNAPIDTKPAAPQKPLKQQVVQGVLQFPIEIIHAPQGGVVNFLVGQPGEKFSKDQVLMTLELPEIVASAQEARREEAAHKTRLDTLVAEQEQAAKIAEQTFLRQQQAAHESLELAKAALWECEEAYRVREAPYAKVQADLANYRTLAARSSHGDTAYRRPIRSLVVQLEEAQRERLRLHSALEVAQAKVTELKRTQAELESGPSVQIQEASFTQESRDLRALVEATEKRAKELEKQAVISILSPKDGTLTGYSKAIGDPIEQGAGLVGFRASDARPIVLARPPEGFQVAKGLQVRVMGTHFNAQGIVEEILMLTGRPAARIRLLDPLEGEPQDGMPVKVMPRGKQKTQ